MLDKCPICETALPGYEPPSSGNLRVNCPVCGNYQIFELTALRAFDRQLQNRHLYSGAIRDLTERGFDVKIRSLEDLRDSVVVPAGPLAQIDRIILYVFRHMESADARVKLLDNDYPIAYARHAREFKFLIDRANEARVS